MIVAEKGVFVLPVRETGPLIKRAVTEDPTRISILGPSADALIAAYATLRGFRINRTTNRGWHAGLGYRISGL